MIVFFQVRGACATRARDETKHPKAQVTAQRDLMEIVAKAGPHSNALLANESGSVEQRLNTRTARARASEGNVDIALYNPEDDELPEPPWDQTAASAK